MRLFRRIQEEEEFPTSSMLEAIRSLPPIDGDPDGYDEARLQVGAEAPRQGGPASDLSLLRDFLEWASPLRPPPMTPQDAASSYQRWLRIQLERARYRVSALMEDLREMMTERDAAYARVMSQTLVSDHSGEDYCEYCGSSGPEMPTHCPVREMTQAQKDGVRTGTVDYARGQWWRAVREKTVRKKPARQRRRPTRKKEESGNHAANGGGGRIEGG